MGAVVTSPGMWNTPSVIRGWANHGQGGVTLGLACGVGSLLYVRFACLPGCSATKRATLPPIFLVLGISGSVYWLLFCLFLGPLQRCPVWIFFGFLCLVLSGIPPGCGWVSNEAFRSRVQGTDIAA